MNPTHAADARTIRHGLLDEGERQAYSSVVAATLRIMDTLSSAAPEFVRMDRCLEHLAAVEALLSELPTLPGDTNSPAHAPGNWRFPPAERGLTPTLTISIEDDVEVVGKVSFSRRFEGTAAVHGGAVSLFFDDFLGRMANRAMVDGVARTAYLHVDYRRLTPVDEELSCRTWVDRVEGHKRFLRGEIRHEGLVVAEAEGLWVSPPGIGHAVTRSP